MGSGGRVGDHARYHVRENGGCSFERHLPNGDLPATVLLPVGHKVDSLHEDVVFVVVEKAVSPGREGAWQPHTWPASVQRQCEQ